MYAKSKAFRNLVIVLAVLLVLGAGLVLLKNLSAQGDEQNVLDSGVPTENPGEYIYGDPSSGEAPTVTQTPSDGAGPVPDDESAE